MVRLSTIYDTELKKRVFVLRGDERYAHSTATTVSVGDMISSGNDAYNQNGYIVPITINVLRDMGDSKVAIYDNDELINLIDWGYDQSTALTINSSRLNWEIDHLITVKYMGNSQCSPSSANATITAKTNPNKYATVLTNTTPNTSFYPNVGQTISFSLTCNELSTDDEIVEVYVDDTKIGDVTVSNNVGSIVYTPPAGTSGLKTVSLRYAGDTNLYSKTLDFKISIGAKVELSGVPVQLYYGGQYEFEAYLIDYHGNNLANKQVILYAYNGNNKVNLATTNTDSYGRASASFTAPQTITNYNQIGAEAIVQGTTYTSKKQTLKGLNISSISMGGDTSVVQGYTANITGQLIADTGSVSGLTVNVNGDINTTVVTDQNGKFSFQYTSEDGYGSANFTVNCANKSKPWSVVEWVTIMRAGKENKNRIERLTTAKLLDLSNGYKLSGTNNRASGRMTIPLTKPYFCSFDVVGISEPTGITINGWRATNLKVGDTVIVEWHSNRCRITTQNSATPDEMITVMDSTNNPYQNLEIIVNNGAISSLTFNNLIISGVAQWW